VSQIAKRFQCKINQPNKFSAVKEFGSCGHHLTCRCRENFLSLFPEMRCACTALACPRAGGQHPQSRWHLFSLSYPCASNQNYSRAVITNSLFAEQHHKRCTVSDSQMAMLKTEGNMSGKVPGAYLNNRNTRDVRRRYILSFSLIYACLMIT